MGAFGAHLHFGGYRFTSIALGLHCMHVPPSRLEWRSHLVRPGVWTAALPLEECEIFEVVLTATWRDVQVRVLESDGTTSRLLLLSDDEELAASVGARLVEPGVYEAAAPTDELVGVQGVTNELAQPER